ncbi:ricin-type beta-trefoil lectin protein [Krasilnikovia cinnamomea]|uniref:Ricin-type beta-trefoil lectin protein n=1 Tax=Krasilnikovia cinnamomea TaxID=349313 RepID=A0A4Q7ZSC9_9ACTN|nr:RICIN domain-containing protein [Krasilnikovia cinnamomea]RZU53523.1 ricin-type beta-trefoil lectin protein [Krasilnikovia cinnamomea]
MLITRRLLTMSAAVCGVLTLVLSGVAGPAQATATTTAQRAAVTATSAFQPYDSNIYNWYSDKCLNVDLRHGPVHNGTKVQMWRCNDYDNELWTYYYDDYTIQSSYDGRCLEASRKTAFRNGGKVQVWTCNGRVNQKWTIYSDGTIVNWYSGLCLDADRKTAFKNGGKVQVWNCNGRTNQRWYF